MKIKPDWSKTKEQIWEEHFAGLDEGTSGSKVHRHIRPIWLYVAAATVALTLVLSSITFFYQHEVTVPKGEHVAYVLPDGSKVTINADSKLSYKPLWWNISREVKLTGEAYFEVTPGSTFNVRSVAGDVTVLGTTFNVYSRSEAYLNVTCLTGKVQVKRDKQSIILTPNMQAEYRNDVLSSYTPDNASQAIGWTNDHFVFLATPLHFVIEEIERQYNIKVATASKLDYLYTGNFSKSKSPEEVLKIIGKPFGIEFKIER